VAKHDKLHRFVAVTRTIYEGRNAYTFLTQQDMYGKFRSMSCSSTGWNVHSTQVWHDCKCASTGSACHSSSRNYPFTPSPPAQT